MTIALLFVFLLAISALVMVTVMQVRPPRLCARAQPHGAAMGGIRKLCDACRDATRTGSSTTSCRRSTQCAFVCAFVCLFVCGPTLWRR